jgi:hypothetical protein
MSSGSNGIGSICQMRSHATSQPSSPPGRGSPAARARACRPSTSGVERALVERQLAAAVERVTIPGLTRTMPVVARTSRAQPRPRGTASALRAAARKASRRTSIGRRARVRVLAGEAHGVALDAEGAEHRPAACRATRARALLDVQLEVGRGAVRGARARRARGRGRRHARAGRRAARVPSRSVRPRTESGSSEPAAALDPSRLRPKRAPSSSAQLTSLSVSGRDSGACARSTSRPARTLRMPSSQPPLGTESRWPRRSHKRSESPGAVAQRLHGGRSASTLTACRSRRARHGNQSLAASSRCRSRRRLGAPVVHCRVSS